MPEMPAPPGGWPEPDPEPPRRRVDWWNRVVAVLAGIAAVGFVSLILTAVNTEPSRVYPTDGSAVPPVGGQPALTDADATALAEAAMPHALKDDTASARAIMAQAEAETGCSITAGGRTDPSPRAAGEMLDQTLAAVAASAPGASVGYAVERTGRGRETMSVIVIADCP